uniref:Strictosidine synthase conserved region domain-containing protein n=1 Tax=Oryza nivara TaxID=4536 RepID=A0A0E0I7R5_ORYNI
MARRRRGFPATLLVTLLRLVGCLLLICLAAPPCAAQQVKTSHAQFAFHLPLPDGVTGAESLAFDSSNHGPYTGVSHGRVLRWGGAAAGWTTFAHHQDYRKIPMCTTPVAPPEETESMPPVMSTSPIYDAATKQVTVLRSGLPYANGVAVSRDGSHAVVAHTVPCQAFRYWIKGPNAGEYELLADLPGYPDNVRRDARGGYWVALNQEKVRLDATAAAVAPPAKHLVGVRLDGDGVEVEELTTAKGVTLSEVVERGGKLWLGSVELDFIGLIMQ